MSPYRLLLWGLVVLGLLAIGLALLAVSQADALRY
jgi:hypothetical protein